MGWQHRRIQESSEEKDDFDGPGLAKLLLTTTPSFVEMSNDRMLDRCCRSQDGVCTGDTVGVSIKAFDPWWTCDPF